jgi:small subunit ribosomal protein SAe
MNFPQSLNPSQEDIKTMLACKAHIGDINCNPKMERYIYKKRNNDGVNIINLAKTYEKLILAARVIVAIENPLDVCVISSSQIGQRAVLKYARFTGCNAISGRFTPGTFTNQIQKQFLEPRLLVVTDPRQDAQSVVEGSYVNIPTIAFCNTNCPVRFVDVVIPCNTNSAQTVGLMYWLLAREILRLRGQLQRNQPWDVMVDLFFYRSPDEKLEERKAQEDIVVVHNTTNTESEQGWSNRQQQQQQQQPVSSWTDTPTNQGTGAGWENQTPASTEWSAEIPGNLQAGNNWSQF